MNSDRPMKLATLYGSRHRLLIARVRIGVGVWWLILTAILLGTGQSGWWAALLVPAAALHFYLAYRAPRAIGARTNSRHA
jgi:hypothetical protein